MAHYRDTYRPAKFLFLDVRVGVVIFASLVHVRYWTLGLDVIVIALSWYVERIGLGFMGALRAVRAWMTGSYRPAMRVQKIRRRVDYDARTLAWQVKRPTDPVLVEEVKPDPKSLIKGNI